MGTGLKAQGAKVKEKGSRFRGKRHWGTR